MKTQLYVNGPRAGKPPRAHAFPVGAWVQLVGTRRVGEVTSTPGPYSLCLDDCLTVGESSVDKIVPRPAGAASWFETTTEDLVAQSVTSRIAESTDTAKQLCLF